MNKTTPLTAEFFGANVLSMLIDDETLARLLQAQDLDHEGVPDVLDRLVARQVPLDDPLVGRPS